MKNKLLGLLILLVIAVYITTANQFRSISKTSHPISFEVKSGQGIKEISDNLHKALLIHNALVFDVYAKLRSKPLLTGIYTLNQNQGLVEIFNQISHGDVSEITITIPEGWRVEEIAERLAQNNLVSKSEFIQLAAAKEGKMFPDTYRFSTKSTPQDIINVMLKNYEKRIKDAGIIVDESSLIIASIIEREAASNVDRDKIADVFKNRINIGMALEADPTVQFARDSISHPVKYWLPLSASDLKIASQFNTYISNKLPPSPICNPGIESLKSAVKPIAYKYLFFFHTKDKEAIFSYTLAEHNRNRAKHGV